MDSAALASALNETQKLKLQLDRVTESEGSQARCAESGRGEILSLRVELTESLELVEKLKKQLDDSRESEAKAYDLLLAEVEETKKKANAFEELVSKLKGDLAKSEGDVKSLDREVGGLKREVDELRGALEAAERRYHDQYLESTLQIRDAYELVKRAKEESLQRESEFVETLDESRAEVEKLKVNLVEKEKALQSVQFELNKSESELEAMKVSLLEKETNLQSNNEGKNHVGIELNKSESKLKVMRASLLLEILEKETNLESNNEGENHVGIELNKSESELEAMKASLLEKEAQLQSINQQNEALKSEISKWEMEKHKANDEAMMKVERLTEEADESCRRASRVAEELDAAQSASSEMEDELRRLKVQSDQWRKAAEAAAAMLSNGKFVERTGSLDYHTVGGKFGLSYSEDTDDESTKKKNGNMLKKIGVLLKKGQK